MAGNPDSASIRDAAAETVRQGPTSATACTS